MMGGRVGTNVVLLAIRRISCIAIGVIILLVFYAIVPLGDKLVCRECTPEGMVLVIYQRCNYSAEPYNTRFYFRGADGVWHTYQIDFQDIRWLHGRIVCDSTSGVACIYRNGRRYATFDMFLKSLSTSDRTWSNASIVPSGRLPWEK